jgi:hypothetical protein
MKRAVAGTGGAAWREGNRFLPKQFLSDRPVTGRAQLATDHALPDFRRLR